jgi:hypothetical protein
MRNAAHVHPCGFSVDSAIVEGNAGRQSFSQVPLSGGNNLLVLNHVEGGKKPNVRRVLRHERACQRSNPRLAEIAKLGEGSQPEITPTGRHAARIVVGGIEVIPRRGRRSIVMEHLTKRFVGLKNSWAGAAHGLFGSGTPRCP